MPRMPSEAFREIPMFSDLPARIAALADSHELAWLDSSDRRSDSGCWSVVGIDPIAHLVQDHAAPAELRVGTRVHDRDASAWRLARRAMARTTTREPRSHDAPALGPGWIGHLAFELADQLERLPPPLGERPLLPSLRLALYDRVLVIDHEHQRAWEAHAPRLRERLDLPPTDRPGITELLDGAPADIGEPAPPAVSFDDPAYAQTWYESAVRRALEYIASGDIYQVNLAHRIALRTPSSPARLYAAMRNSNPSPFGALLSWPGGGVASVSPERFLSLRGRSVLTSPIKGTRPRTGDPALDRAAEHTLLASAKDAAELAMIVDLHRNDLGRVCEFGSVRVVSSRRVERHPRVVHTVADVAGVLRPGVAPIDLVAAAFPAGSISGVPKIRAMQILRELEPMPRGVYTGAIGWFGVGGDISLSVAIRTVQLAGDRGWLHVGGGIVAESDPADEFAETIAKARGIVDALAQGTQQEPTCANWSASTAHSSHLTPPP